MAKTPEAAIKLLTDLVPAATAKARGEAAAMQALIDAQHGGFTLAPWDWQYYAEQVRTAQYALDEEQIKPYFELDRVLRDGVFYAANQLYGLTFKERKDLPVYHPDVRVFEVFDADGDVASGCSTATTSSATTSRAAPGRTPSSTARPCSARKPVVFNVANFTKPAAGQPALLTYDDVTTMFHEFGHGLHALLVHRAVPAARRQRADRLRGVPLAVQRALGAVPVGVRALRPALPDGRADAAGAGGQDQAGADLQSGLRDHRVRRGGAARHGVAHAAARRRSRRTWTRSRRRRCARYHVDVPEVPPRYRTNYFAHIWDGGYSANYYAYLWSEVLDDDAYAWFTEHGGLTRANGQRFRDMILSRGGSADVGAMYRAFRGRDPVVGPLLEARGLVPTH